MKMFWRTILMNQVMLALCVFSVGYQIVQSTFFRSVGSVMGQVLVVVAPAITIWALKAQTPSLRNIALTANSIVVASVVLAALLGAQAGVGVVLSFAVFFAPFLINVVILKRITPISTSTAPPPPDNQRGW